MRDKLINLIAQALWDGICRDRKPEAEKLLAEHEKQIRIDELTLLVNWAHDEEQEAGLSYHDNVQWFKDGIARVANEAEARLNELWRM